MRRLPSLSKSLKSRGKKSGAKNKLDGLVVGYSETQSAVAFYFHTYPDADFMHGIQPITFYEVDTEFLGAPSPSPR